MKLSNERKTALGLTHEAEDVPEDLVLPAIDRLVSQAAAGTTLLGHARAECLRVATLATTGSAEGNLPEALAGVINQAGPEQLDGLTKMYRAQAAERFPLTCQSCGKQDLSGRSSIEDRAEIEKPLKTKASQKPATTNSLF